MNNLKPSLEIELEGIQKAHDAIHEFLYIAPLLLPDQGPKGISWHNKSAFLVYHWEAFSQAHRSLIEALCASYNSGFILLRTVLELIIKGAFYECLSQSEYRNNSKVLDKDKNGKNLKKKVTEILAADSDAKEKLNRFSGSLFDIIEKIIDDPEYRPSIKQIIYQLEQWGIFDPIPNPSITIYEGLYRKLSADVHVIPDRTDIGRRLIEQENGLFEQRVHQNTLHEFTQSLLEVMDAAIVAEINIMKDFLAQNSQSKANLKERLGCFNQLNLKYSSSCVKLLLRQG